MRIRLAFAALLLASDLAAARAEGVAVGPDGKQITVEVPRDDAAYSLLPANVHEAGTLTFGVESNAGYPNSITKDSANYGLTVDLGRALAAAMGIKPVLQTMPFSNIIPALGSGRIDVSPSLVLDTPERRQVLDFVDASYSTAFGFLVKKDSPFTSITDATACGHVIAANSGSSQALALKARSAACEQAGKPPIDIKLTTNVAEAALAVQSGRAEAAYFMGAFANFAAKANPDLTAASSGADFVRTGVNAIAFKKGSPLAPAARAAMLSLLRSGAWQTILAQYNWDQALPSEAVVRNTETIPPGPPSL